MIELVPTEHDDVASADDALDQASFADDHRTVGGDAALDAPVDLEPAGSAQVSSDAGARSDGVLDQSRYWQAELWLLSHAGL